MSIVTLLVGLLIWCLIAWGVRTIMAAFSIGNPIASVVNVILVILFILWLLSVFGLWAPPLVRLQ